MKKTPAIIVGVGGAAYILYIYLYVGVGKLLAILSRTDLHFLILSIVFLIASITLHGLSWHILLGGGFRNSSRVISTTVISLFTSYIVPVGAASEVIRFLIATRVLGINAFLALSTIFFHRICITLSPLIAVAAVILYAGSGILTIERATFTTLIAIYLSFIVSPNILALGFMRTKIFERVVKRFEKHFERFTGQNLDSMYEMYRRSIADLLGRWRGMAALLISMIEWVFLVLSMYSIFMALGVKRDILYAVFSILLIQILWWILPISFGGSIGVSDLIASIAYQLLSFPADVSTSIVLLYRISSLTSLLILLYPSARSIGIHVGEVRRIYREGGRNT
ncbi:MAG: lysylphosphatidylglycerol synthase transmembrane domain-containing protein [Sulfolobales archaeon]